MPDYNTMSYEKMLLDGMRMFAVEPSNVVLTNENLVMAMTLNENLKELGYTLKPSDIVRVAKSPSLRTFYDDFESLLSDVKAKPMYPNFPTQVMEMDEATYRFHQMIHYFSTYGVEMIFGGDVQVARGWMPEAEDTEKTEKDTKLLQAEAIELIDENEKYRKPFERILSKRERMTEMEREIVHRCVCNGNLDFSSRINVPFKENLTDIFAEIAHAGGDLERIPRETATKALFNICQHPGDVTENLKKYLISRKYKLTTREKKMFVSLYEKYDAKAFAANTDVSRKKQPEIREIFTRIDFLKYAHNQEMIDAVRNIGKAPSWEGRARKRIEDHEPDALEFAGKRPGMLLRMVSMALRNGYSAEEISKELVKASDALSVQTMLMRVNQLQQNTKRASKGYMIKDAEMQRKYAKASRYARMNQDNKEVAKAAENIDARIRAAEEKENRRINASLESREDELRVVLTALAARMQMLETGLEGKKIYLDESSYDFSQMAINPMAKSMYQGYLPSATTFKIPEEARRIRMFVYWNDDLRVDIDLHANGSDMEGNPIHVGWNSKFKESGIVMSGDITHSDAAEYIDIDLKEAKDDVDNVNMLIDVYTLQRFNKIKECFAGIMAVDKLGENVRLYDRANCMFSQDITNDSTRIIYGNIDVQNRVVRYFGLEPLLMPDMNEMRAVKDGFSLKTYISMLAEAQGAVIVDSREDADVTLTLTKPKDESEISLIDTNFFCDAPTKKPAEQREKKNGREERPRITRERAEEIRKSEGAMER